MKEKLGIGVVSIKGNTCTFAVHSFQLIVDVLLPIFDKYPLFSNKQYDYLRFKSALLSEIIYYEDLPKYIRSNKPINSIESIISASYFSA